MLQKNGQGVAVRAKTKTRTKMIAIRLLKLEQNNAKKN